MSLSPLDKILESVTRQPGWETYRQYCRVVAVWQEVINPRLVSQTRAVSLSRGVLSVATSSAALAQELSLQRYGLLTRLNALLDESLEDIHFSSARWHDRPSVAPREEMDSTAITEHPSYVEESEITDSFQGFERWQEKIRQRALSWPICPSCKSPTPSGEIDRWNCCAFCVSRISRERY